MVKVLLYKLIYNYSFMCDRGNFHRFTRTQHDKLKSSEPNTDMSEKTDCSFKKNKIK